MDKNGSRNGIGQEQDATAVGRGERERRRQHENMRYEDVVLVLFVISRGARQLGMIVRGGDLLSKGAYLI